MRLFVRIVFGLNAVYQLLVGVVALALPRVFASLYGVADAALTPAFLALSRGFGGTVLLGAAISVFIARNPDRNPVLLPVMALLGALTIAAWCLSLAAEEMEFEQAALDLVAQLLIIVAVAGYWRRMSRPAAHPEAPGRLAA